MVAGSSPAGPTNFSLVSSLCHTSVTQGTQVWQLSVNAITVGKFKFGAANMALFLNHFTRKQTTQEDFDDVLQKLGKLIDKGLDQLN